MGPTKEELEKYFKNNRKYFDELAKNYKITDPEYYNKYIAPFYRFPGFSGTGNIARQRRVMLFAVLAVVINLGIFFAVFYTQKSSEVKRIISTEDVEELTKEMEKNADTSLYISKDLKRLSDTMKIVKEDNDFKQGKFLFKVKKYDEAEKYLKLVPENHPEYKEVESMLKEIKKLKKQSK